MGSYGSPGLSIGKRTRPSIALVEQLRAVSYDRLRHRERQKLTGADIDSVKFVLRQMVDVG